MRADALLFGRVTYQLMESAWRQPAREHGRPRWIDADIEFARKIDAARKYVVSSTLDQVDWNAELVKGDLGTAVRRLKEGPGEGLFVGGVNLPLALTELGLIDEYEFVVHPVVAGHGPTLFAGLRERLTSSSWTARNSGPERSRCATSPADPRPEGSICPNWSRAPTPGAVISGEHHTPPERSVPEASSRRRVSADSVSLRARRSR